MKTNCRKIGFILLIFFTLLTMISGGMFLHQYMDSKKSSVLVKLFGNTLFGNHALYRNSIGVI